jgi:hypothetical protein
MATAVKKPKEPVPFTVVLELEEFEAVFLRDFTSHGSRRNVVGAKNTALKLIHDALLRAVPPVFDDSLADADD